MDNDNVLKLIDEEMVRIREIFDTKGHDYTRGDIDQLINFKRNGTRMEISKYKVWGVYWSKHVDRIFSFLKHGKVKGETVQESIRDVILYNLLLLALIKEDENIENLPANMETIQKSMESEEEPISLDDAIARAASEAVHPPSQQGTPHRVYKTPDGRFTNVAGPNTTPVPRSES